MTHCHTLPVYCMTSMKTELVCRSNAILLTKRTPESTRETCEPDQLLDHEICLLSHLSLSLCRWSMVVGPWHGNSEIWSKQQVIFIISLRNRTFRKISHKFLQYVCDQKSHHLWAHRNRSCLSLVSPLWYLFETAEAIEAVSACNFAAKGNADSCLRCIFSVGRACVAGIYCVTENRRTTYDAEQVEAVEVIFVQSCSNMQISSTAIYRTTQHRSAYTWNTSPTSSFLSVLPASASLGRPNTRYAVPTRNLRIVSVHTARNARKDSAKEQPNRKQYKAS